MLTLLVDEIGAMPELPLSAPLPHEPRLAHACQRFLEAPTQSVSITDVAFELGFSSASAFTALFRRNLGDTPARYLAKSKAAALF